jgi:hypothetical protein
VARIVASIATSAVDNITANSTGPRSLRRPMDDRVTGVTLTLDVQPVSRACHSRHGVRARPPAKRL